MHTRVTHGVVRGIDRVVCAAASRAGAAAPHRATRASWQFGMQRRAALGRRVCRRFGTGARVGTLQVAASVQAAPRIVAADAGQRAHRADCTVRRWRDAGRAVWAAKNRRFRRLRLGALA